MIYTAAQNPTKNASPLFKEFKIENMQSVEIGDVPIYATSIPKKGLFAHALENNVQDFALAQLNHVFVTIEGKPRNVFKAIDHLTRPLELPVGVFHFETVSASTEGELRKAHLQQDPNDKGAWIGSPLSHQIGEIFKLSPVQKGFRPGLVNHLGYLAYIQCMRGAQVLSYVGRAATFGDEANTLFFTDAVIDSFQNPIPIPSLEGTMSIDFSGQATFSAPHRYAISPNCVAVASPLDSRGKLDGFFTTYSNPVLPGAVNMHFFPYFHGLLDADRDFTFEIFNRYLMHCVSDTPEGVSRQRKQIRMGLRNLAPTRSGKVLNHMYYGLHLSLEYVGRISFVEENGNYEGFIIAFNQPIEFQHLSILHKAKDRKEILEELQDLGKHDKALKGILARLNTVLDGSGQPMNNFVITDIDTSYTLVKALRTGHLESLDNEQKNLLGNLLGDLRFNFQEPVKEEKPVLDFLNFLASGDMTVLKDYSFYITPQMVHNLSDLFIGLSIFGTRPPSLNYGGKDGLAFTIPTEGVNDPNILTIPRPLQYLPFKYCSFSDAYVQWKSLLESGSMSFTKARKNKKEFVSSAAVDLRIMNDPGFTNAYGRIKQWVNKGRRNASEGKKRINPLNEDGARKRQKKEAASTGEDL